MSIPMIDCHQHLVYPDRFPYGWAEGIPALQGAFTYEDYLGQIEGKGNIRALFMETSPDHPHGVDEARFVMELADRSDSVIDGLILTCRPEAEGKFDAYVESLQHPKLVGLRRTLHDAPDEVSQDARFRENVGKLAGHNLTFDLCCLPRQLPLARELAASCGGVQFVLDHCGIPNVAGQELDPWRAKIRDLAELPHVACKISGVLAYCDPAHADADAIRPFVEHCIESFGWDRVVWGSDWPVVGMTRDLPAWIDIIRELVSGEDEANQRKLFSENALRLYNVPTGDVL